MIIVDQSETRSTSRFPHIKGATISSNLEAITGADCMVSPISLPVSTETLIRRHIEKGAVLVQFKSGRDLVESVFHREKTALARMHSVGAKWWQSCILATGVFLPNVKNGTVLVGKPELHRDGRVTFKWSMTSKKYKAFVTAQRRFFLRGGWLQILLCEEETKGWVLHMESDLKSLSKNPTKVVSPAIVKFPPPDAEPLQDVKEVKDCRSVIAALDGIGIILACRLYDTIRAWNEQQKPLDRGWTKKDWEPTLMQMVDWGTMWKPELYNLPKVARWPRSSVRSQFGLVEGQEIDVVQRYVPEEKQ